MLATCVCLAPILPGRGLHPLPLLSTPGAAGDPSRVGILLKEQLERAPQQPEPREDWQTGTFEYPN